VGYGWKEFAHAKPFEIGQPQRWVQFAHSHHEFFCFFDPSRPNIIPPSKSGLLVDSWAASAMPDRRRQKGLRGRVLQTPDAFPVPTRTIGLPGWAPQRRAQSQDRREAHAGDAGQGEGGRPHAHEINAGGCPHGFARAGAQRQHSRVRALV
jgi:hypothetical protein